MGPEEALAVCRFLHDGAALMLWGSSAYLAFLVPQPLGADLQPCLDAFRLYAIALAVATTALALPLVAATIGEGWPDALNGTTLRTVLVETSVGHAWMLQVVVALLLLATLAATPRRREAATAAASGLVLVTLAATGHAAMHEGWLGVVHRANDAAHLLAAGAWLGALVPLLPILRRLDAPGSPAAAAAALALRRFSTAGHAAVALAIATGIGNTLVVLGRWPTDLSSRYQNLLDAKIALVAVMTALALVNRYALVPRLRRHRGLSLRWLRRGTVAEIALGIAALGCVAVFGLIEPA